MPNAQATKLVSKTSAVTHVLEPVATMQDAKQLITMLSVTVQLVILETPSLDVLSYLRSLSSLIQWTPATHHHVEPMLSALPEELLVHADVSQIILETLMFSADLSA